MLATITRHRSLPVFQGALVSHDSKDFEPAWEVDLVIEAGELGLGALLSENVNECFPTIHVATKCPNRSEIKEELAISREVALKAALTGDDNHGLFFTVAPDLFRFSISRPFFGGDGVAKTSPSCFQALTAADVVPARRQRPGKPPRNFGEELRAELFQMCSQAADEYARLFPLKPGERSPSREEQQRQLKISLTSSGSLHEFFERLKPVVREASFN